MFAPSVRAASSPLSPSSGASSNGSPPQWLLSLLTSPTSNNKPAAGTGATPMDIALAKVNGSQTTSNYEYYSPSEIQQIYDAAPLYKEGYSGAGMTIAIVDAFGDPYIQSELNTFSAAYGLPQTNVNVVCVDGPCNYSSGITYGWTGEIALDVEWSHAMAPGAAIYLYIGSTNAQPLYDAVAAAVAGTNGNGTFYPTPSVVSMSWGQPENDFGESGAVAPVFGENYPWLNQVFQYGTSKGITFFASTGDWGAYDQSDGQTSPYGGAIYPSTDPFVTAVGGTSLYMSTTSGYLQGGWGATPEPSAFGGYGYETAWSWNNNYKWATGGGFSTFFGRPSWQTGPGVPDGGTRGAPDVAWDADPLTGVIVYVGGGFWVYGGTSVGSPSWAGSMALIDSVAGHSLGFINPELYSILNNPSEYARAFHDVTVGDNDPNVATQGWDQVTGMGSPDIANLASILASPSPSLSVTASNSVAPGASAAYGTPVTFQAVVRGVSTCNGYYASAQLASISSFRPTVLGMTCSGGVWSGRYTPFYPFDPAGMWTLTVTVSGRFESGTGMTTFSVGDGITLFSGWGSYLVGDTVPIYAVVTAPGGSVVTSGTFTATFHYGTPTGAVVGTVPLTYDPTTCVEPGVCVFDGYFAIPSHLPSFEQGPWVMTITGSDGSNVAATAYSWLNVGLLAYTYTDSPTYVSGDTINIQSVVWNPDALSSVSTGAYSATIMYYNAAHPTGIFAGTAPLSYVAITPEGGISGVWVGSFNVSPPYNDGFYRVVVSGSDGLGDTANGETLVRVAPESLNLAVNLTPSVAPSTISTVKVSVSVTYPDPASMKIGSVDAFLIVNSTFSYYAPLTYNSLTRTFVGTLPVQAKNIATGTYTVYISAYDPSGNFGAAFATLSVVKLPFGCFFCG